MTASIKSMTKDAILKRLYDLVGSCRTCGAKVCHHEDGKVLPKSISRTDVLRAINLDEKFVKEVAPVPLKKNPAVTHPAPAVTVHRCR